MPTIETAYDADVSAWALEQAAHLRSGDWARLDAAHLADEIEALARTEHHALTSALRVILLHMLKWDQPARAADAQLGHSDPDAACLRGRADR